MAVRAPAEVEMWYNAPALKRGPAVLAARPAFTGRRPSEN